MESMIVDQPAIGDQGRGSYGTKLGMTILPVLVIVQTVLHGNLAYQLVPFVQGPNLLVRIMRVKELMKQLSIGQCIERQKEKAAASTVEVKNGMIQIAAMEVQTTTLRPSH